MWRPVFKLLVPITIILRLLLPWMVFTYPLAIITLVFFIDWFDAPLYYQMGFNRSKYDLIDKTLDFYWYTISLIFAYLYLPLFPLLLAFYILRLVGQIIFYIKRDDKYFIYFPNFYEWALIYIAFTTHFIADWHVSPFNIITIMLIAVLLTKIVHELIVHKYWDRLPEGPEWTRTPSD